MIIFIAYLIRKNNLMTKLLLLIFSFSVLFTRAQGSEISWSKPINISPKTKIKSIHSTKDSILFVCNISDEEKAMVEVNSFDFSMNQIAGQQIKLDVNEIVQSSTAGTSLFIFGVKYHGTEDELIVYRFDKNLNKLDQHSVLRAKANGGYHAYFDIAGSSKGNYLSAISSDGYVADSKENMQSVLMDTLGVVISHNDIRTSILSQKKSYNALTVNDQGGIYIIKRERNKGGDKYYVFTVKGESNQQMELHLKARNIVDMEFTVDTTGNLFLAGFYSPPFKSYFEGSYIKKISINGTELFSKEYLLNENIIYSFQTKKDVKDLGYGLFKFRSTQLKWSDENTLILLAEHNGVLNEGKDGTTDYRKGFVVTAFSDKGGFLYSTPFLSEQTDPKDKGYWSSPYYVLNEKSPSYWFNYLGEGAKKVKENKQPNAAVHIGSVSFNPSGVASEKVEPIINDLENFALVPNIKNRTPFSVVILESQKLDAFSIGIIK